MSKLKRRFTGTSVPVASPLGKILINSKESKQISKAIRKLIKTGKSITVKISEETQDKIKKLNKGI